MRKKFKPASIIKHKLDGLMYAWVSQIVRGGFSQAEAKQELKNFDNDVKELRRYYGYMLLEHYQNR